MNRLNHQKIGNKHLIAACAGFTVMLLLPVILDSYYTYLMTTVLVTALLAMSLNLILGYGGMLQLHQAVFFGTGAYAVTLLLNKSSFPALISFLLAPLVAAFLALAIGWICVRLRGLYFGMMTLAMGQLVWAVIYRWYEFTGGDDGIHEIKVPEFLLSIPAAYYTTLIVVALCLVAIYMILNSPFGIALQAARDNPQRCESVGINIRRHRLIAFVLSGLFAGTAGALFVILERSVSPSLLFWGKSAEIMIMVLLGGLYTFWGPVFGAAGITLLGTYLGINTDYWGLVMGIVLLLLVLFLPQGVLGFAREKISFRFKVGEVEEIDAPDKKFGQIF